MLLFVSHYNRCIIQCTVLQYHDVQIRIH